MNNQRYRVILECDHEIWFLRQHIPESDDTLWCARCGDYRTLGPIHLGAGVLHPDYQWSSFKKRQWSSVMYGRCEVEGCDTILKRPNFQALENAMASHHVNEHTNSSFKTKGLILTDKTLPRNSPPPF